VLYTEMVTAAAIVRGDADRLLAFDAAEHPVALQLGAAILSSWRKQRGSARLRVRPRSIELRHVPVIASVAAGSVRA